MDKTSEIWMTHKNDLLPCPECHKSDFGLNKVTRITSSDGTPKMCLRRYFINCESCGKTLKRRMTIFTAIREWNKVSRKQ